MDVKDNIIGCYFRVGFDPTLNENEFMAIAEKFRPYLWGEKGVCDTLKQLKHIDYGESLLLILFQFYINLTVNELKILKEIESYRSKEKSIGIPIIVNNENFFNKSELERYQFLKLSMLNKLDLLAEVVKKKKLDTKIDLLKSDLKKVLDLDI